VYYHNEKLGWKIFENRAMRNHNLTERERVTEGWRKLRIRELQNVYSSPNLLG
jgi:hypothetical protein